MLNRTVKHIRNISILGILPGILALGCGEEPDSTPLQLVSEHYRANPEASGDTQKTCTIPRSDFVGNQTLGSGNWGKWQECYDFCPAGTFVYQVSLRSESSSAADDTALNGIALACYNRTNGAYQGYITANWQDFGSWLAWSTSNPYTVANPFVGGQMLIEGPISGDDTSANAVRLFSANGNTVQPAAHTSWGSWRSAVYCPAGTAICGLNTRIEAYQGSVWDDTALNGIAVACCRF